MRRAVFLRILVVSPAVFSARSWGSDSVSAGTVTRLCQHVKARKNMIVDRSQPEVVWSDGAMFEIAKSFPRELEEMIATPTSTRDLRTVVARLGDDSTPEWLDAKIVKSGSGAERAIVESRDGKVTLQVASPYFDYLHARYPNARLRIKNNLSPVLFKVGATVRGCVMPVQTTPPRTP